MCFNNEEYINLVIRAPIHTLTKKTRFWNSNPRQNSPARSGDLTPKRKLLPGPIGRDGPIPSGESALHSFFAMLWARSGEDARVVVRSSARSGEMAQCHRAKPRIPFPKLHYAPDRAPLPDPIGRSYKDLDWRISSSMQPFSTLIHPMIFISLQHNWL